MLENFPFAHARTANWFACHPRKLDGLTDDEDFDDAKLGEIEVADVAGQVVVDDDEDDTLNEELTNPMWTKDHGTFDNELPNEDPAQLPAELSLKEPYDLFRVHRRRGSWFDDPGNSTLCSN